MHAKLDQNGTVIGFTAALPDPAPPGIVPDAFGVHIGWTYDAASDSFTDQNGVVYRRSPSSFIYVSDAVQASEVRELRDNYLADTDWIVTKYMELGQPIPADWAAYRQALRDVPQQPGFPWSVTWPTVPTTKP